MTSSNPLQLLGQLATGVERTRHGNYCDVASFTIMVLDWLLTLDAEVAHIWNSHWNATRPLYLIARYLPFIDTSIVMYHQFGYDIPRSVCQSTYQYASFSFVFGIGLSELVFTLRTWAVWDKNRRLTAWLFGTFSVIWGAELIVTGNYLSGIIHQASPMPQLLGCIVQGPSMVLSVDYILLLAFDTGIMILMIVRGISTFKLGGGDGSRLVRVVYTEGVMYYIYLFGLAFLNIIIILKLPGDYTNLFIMMQRVIHSVFACRVVLHIRQRLSEEPPTVPILNPPDEQYNVDPSCQGDCDNGRVGDKGALCHV